MSSVAAHGPRLSSGDAKPSTRAQCSFNVVSAVSYDKKQTVLLTLLGKVRKVVAGVRQTYTTGVWGGVGIKGILLLGALFILGPTLPL